MIPWEHIRIYQVTRDLDYPRQLTRGEGIATDPIAPLTVGEDVLIITRSGRRILGTLERQSRCGLSLRGAYGHDEVTWLSDADVVMAEAVVGYYLHFDAPLPDIMDGRGDFIGPLARLAF